MTARAEEAGALPPWLTHAQHAALRTLVEWLDAASVAYVASGGLAGNLHGSRWPLHDIDVDVPRDVQARIASDFAHAVRFGPAPYADAEFELDLLTLSLGGVEVDVSAAESVVLRSPDGARHASPTDLRVAEERTVAGLRVRVLPLDRLIAYKRLIGRRADCAELESLRTMPAA